MTSQNQNHFAFFVGLMADALVVAGEQLDQHLPEGAARSADDAVTSSFHERAEAVLTPDFVAILADCGNTYRSVQSLYVPVPDELMCLLLGGDPSSWATFQFEEIEGFLPDGILTSNDTAVREVFGERARIFYTPETIVVLFEQGNQYCQFQKVFTRYL